MRHTVLKMLQKVITVIGSVIQIKQGEALQTSNYPPVIQNIL